MRHDISLLGIAPLTSMFFAGKASPARDDYRPEIHDSDGLYVADRQGRAHLAAVGQSRRSRRLGVPGQQPARLRPDAARARLRALSGHRRGPARTAEPVGRAGRRLGRRRGAAGRDPDPGGDQRQHRRLLGLALAGQEGRAQGICLPAFRPVGRGRAFAGRPHRGDARRRGAGPTQAAAHGGRVRRRRARLARAGTTRHVRRCA